MAQQGLDDISRCPGFQPSGCRRMSKHVWAQVESHRFREPLKQLLGVVVAQWFTQRRLVEVDENEIAAVTLGYLGPLELIVGVEVDDVGSDRDRSGKRLLASEPFALARRRTWICGPPTEQPRTLLEASKCMSSRRRPSASPILMPDSARIATRSLSRTRGTAAMTEAICSAVRDCGGVSTSPSRSARDRTVRNWLSSPKS